MTQKTLNNKLKYRDFGDSMRILVEDLHEEIKKIPNYEGVIFRKSYTQLEGERNYVIKGKKNGKGIFKKRLVNVFWSIYGGSPQNIDLLVYDSNLFGLVKKKSKNFKILLNQSPVKVIRKD